MELTDFIQNFAPSLLPILGAVFMVLFVQDRWSKTMSGKFATAAQIALLSKTLENIEEDVKRLKRSVIRLSRKKKEEGEL